jgi:hypothetical protein
MTVGFAKRFDGWLFAFVLGTLCISAFGPILPAIGHMYWHDEASVLSVAAAYFHGQPMYTPAGSSDSYSLLYGPAAYLVWLPPMIAGAVHVWVYQAWVVLPLFGAALCCLLLARRSGDKTGTAMALVAYLSADLLQSQTEWIIKGNPWMTLLATSGLVAATQLSRPVAVFVAAICSAALVDIRATTLFIAAMPIALLWRRFGVAAAAQCTVFVAVLACSAFLLPHVVFRDYLLCLSLSTHHGFTAVNMLQNVRLIGFMLLPSLCIGGFLFTSYPAVLYSWLRDRRWLFLLGLAACAVTVVTGGKVGAGPHHSVPLSGSIVYMTASLWRLARSHGYPSRRVDFVALAATATLLLGMGLVLAATHIRIFRGVGDSIPPGHVIETDLITIMQSHPGTAFEMGYGTNESYEYTWARPALVLAGNYYSLDADTMDESMLSGVSTPAAAYQRLGHCGGATILIPRGDRPYSMKSMYFAGRHIEKPLFPPEFQEQFLHLYERTESSRYFDLWTARNEVCIR